MLKLCVDAGGCLTGEHGVGIEKRDLMRYQFSEADLIQQMRVKAAFESPMVAQSRQVFPAIFKPALRPGRYRLMSDIHMPSDEAELAGFREKRRRQRAGARNYGFRSSGRRAGRSRCRPWCRLRNCPASRFTSRKSCSSRPRRAAPLHEVEAALARHGQELAFEPADMGALRRETMAATVGSIAAMNISGPRRILRGRRAITCWGCAA